MRTPLRAGRWFHARDDAEGAAVATFFLDPSDCESLTRTTGAPPGPESGSPAAAPKRAVELPSVWEDTLRVRGARIEAPPRSTRHVGPASRLTQGPDRPVAERIRSGT